jgi:hypothetical protein
MGLIMLVVLNDNATMSSSSLLGQEDDALLEDEQDPAVAGLLASASCCSATETVAAIIVRGLTSLSLSGTDDVARETLEILTVRACKPVRALFIVPFAESWSVLNHMLLTSNCTGNKGKTKNEQGSGRKVSHFCSVGISLALSGSSELFVLCD